MELAGVLLLLLAVIGAVAFMKLGRGGGRRRVLADRDRPMTEWADEREFERAPSISTAVMDWPIGREMAPSDAARAELDGDLSPTVAPMIVEPVESFRAEPADANDRPHWKGTTLIALGLTAAAIAIRRRLR